MSHNPHQADRHLRLLVDVVRGMSETFELRPLLESAERAARSALGCERATIFLYDRASDELYSQLATGAGEIRFSAKLGIAGEAVRTGQVIVVPDAYADPRFNPEIDRQTGYRTRNILTLPLTLPDAQVIGALQLLNKSAGGFDAGDELLAGALGALLAIAIKRQRLLDAEADKKRLERDLAIARQIQFAMLPDADPLLAGYDIAGWNQPADQTGGDCYTFQSLADGRLLFLVADASGHGIGPALVVTQCRAMARVMADCGAELPDIAGRVNRLLCEDLTAGRFITVCLGTVDPRAHRLSYVSAGHGPMLLYRDASGAIERCEATGLPMGIMPDSEYTPATVLDLGPGDLFCLVTDGFLEWARPDGELYGEKRLGELLRRCCGLSSAALIPELHHDVVSFSRGTVQADDLTAVLIRRCR